MTKTKQNWCESISVKWSNIAPYPRHVMIFILPLCAWPIFILNSKEKTNNWENSLEWHSFQATHHHYSTGQKHAIVLRSLQLTLWQKQGWDWTLAEAHRDCTTPTSLKSVLQDRWKIPERVNEHCSPCNTQRLEAQSSPYPFSMIFLMDTFYKLKLLINIWPKMICHAFEGSFQKLIEIVHFEIQSEHFSARNVSYNILM